MKTELFLAFRYLFRGGAKHVSFISVVSCVGIMLGVATLVTVISVMNGFDKHLMDKLMRFNYHIVVEGLGGNVPVNLADRISRIPGVVSVSPFVQTQVFGRFSNYIVPLVVRGVDFGNPSEAKTFSRYILEERCKEGFFVGEGLKERFFIQDKLYYYPLSRQVKLKEARVRGTFKVGLYDIDNNYLICSISEAKNLGKNYILSLGINVEDPFKAGKVKENLMWLENKGFLVRTWMESNEVLFSALKLEKITMFVILSLIVVVASFNVFATFTVKVVEKTRDIGILKALGFDSRKVLSIFCLQGTLLGMIGVVAGISLGLGLCYLLKEYKFIHLPAQVYYIDYLPVYVNVRDILVVSLIGLLLSFVSSLFPALRASRLSPSEALRYE